MGDPAMSRGKHLVQVGWALREVEGKQTLKAAWKAVLDGGSAGEKTGSYIDSVPFEKMAFQLHQASHHGAERDILEGRAVPSEHRGPETQQT